jgi:hypothetical protein
MWPVQPAGAGTILNGLGAIIAIPAVIHHLDRRRAKPFDAETVLMASSTCGRTIRARAIRRRAVSPQNLERMGLATAAGPGQWMIGLEAEPVSARPRHAGAAPGFYRTWSGSWYRRLRD